MTPQYQKSERYVWLSQLLNALSSSRLALLLVLLLIFFSIGGTVLPQEGRLDPEDIRIWQEARPLFTRLLRPLGLFHVFNSWPFLGTIFLLGINTLTCTVLRFKKEGGITALKGPNAVMMAGFLCLHLSILVLLAGCFISSATRLNGYILLTEGQSFKEQHSDYLRLSEGPLRPERHRAFVVRMKDIKLEYERKFYQVDVSTNLEIFMDGKKVKDGIVKINYPFTYRGLDFTLDKTGFSPRLLIRKKGSNNLIFNSFLALKTFSTDQGRLYRDFIPLPFFKNRIFLTLYPDFSRINGEVIKAGDLPENPMLLIEMEDASGNVISDGYLPAGGQLSLGGYTFLFADLRQWASFMVVNDPGYPVVLTALCLGLAALLLRYIPDLRKWFSE